MTAVAHSSRSETLTRCFSKLSSPSTCYPCPRTTVTHVPSPKRSKLGHPRMGSKQKTWVTTSLARHRSLHPDELDGGGAIRKVCRAASVTGGRFWLLIECSATRTALAGCAGGPESGSSVPVEFQSTWSVVGVTVKDDFAEACRRVAAARESNAELLDLGDLLLTRLPEELARCVSLRVLSIGRSRPSFGDGMVKWEWEVERPPQTTVSIYSVLASRT